MKRESVQDLLAMMQGAYPNYDPLDKKMTINVWTTALEDYSEKEVILAFKAYLKSNSSGFAPSPGQLVEKIHQISGKKELNEMEAWGLIVKILNSDGGMKNQFEELPEIVQKSVGGYEVFRDWANSDNLNREIARQSFVRCYLKEAEEMRMFKTVRLNNEIAKNNEIGIEQKG